MIITSMSDYRSLAKRKLPRFIFDYLDGGSYTESTLMHNKRDLEEIKLIPRVLRDMSHLSLETELFGNKYALPIVFAPVALAGLYAARGEVQMAKAASNLKIPYTLSTLSICSLQEVSVATDKPIWLQLYIFKDRGLAKALLLDAERANITTLVITVDTPTLGPRYRDYKSGLNNQHGHSPKKFFDLLTNPAWIYSTLIKGSPLTLGNVSSYLKRKINLKNGEKWVKNNLDTTLNWSDLDWIRENWKGKIIIKGIMDSQDAKDVAKFKADGLVVSNHGGRQLDGVLSTVRALPKIADAVGNDLTVMVDSGIQSGLDVVRMLSLGAKAVMLGRPPIYALAAHGQKGVENLIHIYTDEIKTAMILMGCSSISELSPSNLALSESIN